MRQSRGGGSPLCARRLNRRYEGGDRNKLRRLPALLGVASIVCAVLSGFAASARANDLEVRDDPIAALRSYVQLVAAAQPDTAAAAGTIQAPASVARSESDDDGYANLRAFVQRIPADPPQSTTKRLKVAEADNAFDALREFLQKQNGAAAPEQQKMSPPARPRAPLAEAPVIEATFVGSNVCLGCHTGQAETFSHTLMGRLSKQGKLQCETCHGPGSAHVHSVGCAACHGDGGITTRPGIPSLVGQDPQYLVAAMKAYVTGQRKHALMNALLSGVGEAEFNNIALYYARQIPARAQTPPVGDPAAGKACYWFVCQLPRRARCQCQSGVSKSRGSGRAIPRRRDQSLQGWIAQQDRRLRGVSRRRRHQQDAWNPKPGRAGPQYLVAAMKAYVTGQRKNAVMKALLAGVGDAELNDIAALLRGQTPARAQTPPVGDAAAGKTASAACAGCHGEQGVSANPAWPSLAGQDARYLADALESLQGWIA